MSCVWLQCCIVIYVNTVTQRGGSEYWTEGAKSTLGIINANLQRSQVTKPRGGGEDWFKPVLNIHTSLPPTCNPNLFAHPQLRSQNKLFLG
jgi:hypothetical protein